MKMKSTKNLSDRYRFYVVIIRFNFLEWPRYDNFY